MTINMIKTLINLFSLQLIKNNNKQTGFSLLELMVALVIVAILAAIAAPSFTTMISNNRMLSQAQDMTGGFKLARSEAIKRGTAVTLCPSSNGTSCIDNSSLDSGWIVFVDNSNPGVVNTGEEIITYRNQVASGSISVSFSGGIKYLRFSSQGYLSN